MAQHVEKAPPAALLRRLDSGLHKNAARDFLAAFQLTAPARPDLRFLEQILQKFILIPYENLSKILQYEQHHQDFARLRLPEEVWEDFQRHRLGGTCFSLTFFLKTIVDFAGYTSYPVMARMKAGDNRHCALVVAHAGTHYLLDPGYALDRPLPLDAEQPLHYQTAHTGVEVRRGEAPLAYHLYTFSRQAQQWRYAFRDVPVSDAGFLQHWLDSFSWNGMNGLFLTRVRRDSLIYVHNYFMRETRRTGKQNFNLKRNREQMIQELFGIAPEIVERADAARRLRLAKERT